MARSRVISASFTRPNNTDAYTAGDVVCNSTSAPTVMHFEESVRVVGGSGVITKASILDYANQGTKLECELWLFTDDPAAVNDNAAFAPSDAELANLIGVIPIVDDYVGLSGSGASGSVVIQSAIVDLPFQAATATSTIYGVLVARNAYTPIAQEPITVRIHVIQD